MKQYIMALLVSVALALSVPIQAGFLSVAAHSTAAIAGFYTVAKNKKKYVRALQGRSSSLHALASLIVVGCAEYYSIKKLYKALFKETKKPFFYHKN